jgi:hypothetical protein
LLIGRDVVAERLGGQPAVRQIDRVELAARVRAQTRGLGARPGDLRGAATRSPSDSSPSLLLVSIGAPQKPSTHAMPSPQ